LGLATTAISRATARGVSLAAPGAANTSMRVPGPRLIGTAATCTAFNLDGPSTNNASPWWPGTHKSFMFDAPLRDTRPKSPCFFTLIPTTYSTTYACTFGMYRYLAALLMYTTTGHPCFYSQLLFFSLLAGISCWEEPQQSPPSPCLVQECAPTMP